MEEINKSRLAQLAYSLVVDFQVGRKLTFDMGSYSKNGGLVLLPCETKKFAESCCFLGYAPFVFKELEEVSQWRKVSEFILGDDYSIQELFFLIESNWPNNRLQAANRALWVLQGKELNDFKTPMSFFLHFRKSKILESLKLYF